MNNIEIIVADLIYPMNIGNIARTMSCAGLKKLGLVRPCKKWNNIDAVKFSLFGRDVLEGATLYKSLEELKDDDSILFGFSRRMGRKRSHPVMLTELGEFMRKFQNKKKIKLIFGGESAGLSTEDLRLCDHIVTIDKSIVNNSLSLPTAVAMAIYEVKRSYVNNKVAKSDKIVADKGQSGALLERSKALLLQTRFIDKRDEKRVGAKLQGIIKKLSTSDVRLIHSILRNMEEVVK